MFLQSPIISSLQSQITALKPGTFTLKTLPAQIVIRKESKSAPRSILEQLFGGGNSFEEFPVAVQSKDVNIKVIPLPEKNKPQEFSGSVGKFTLQSYCNSAALKVNEAFTLKVTIQGEGNFNLVQLPSFLQNDSIEFYEPKSTLTENSKQFVYTGVVRQSGNITIPPLKFCFFNPETAQYETLSTEAYKLTISGNSNSQTTILQPSQKTNTANTPKTKPDIHYIDTHLSPSTKPAFMPFKGWYLTLFLLLIVLLTWRIIQFYQPQKFLYKSKSHQFKSIYLETSHCILKLNSLASDPIAFHNELLKIWQHYFNKINVIKGSDYSFNQIDLLPVSTEIAYKLEILIKESEQFVYTRQNNFTDASTKIQEHVQLLKNIHHAIQNKTQA